MTKKKWQKRMSIVKSCWRIKLKEVVLINTKHTNGVILAKAMGV